MKSILKSQETKVRNQKVLKPYTAYRIQHITSLFFFLLFSLTSVTSCDREEMIINSWRLQTVLMNNEPLNDSSQFNVIPRYTYYSFFIENRLNVRTYALGQSTASSDGFYRFLNRSTIEMRFTILNEQYKIEATIKKLTRKELNLEYEDNGNTYFLQLFAY